MKLSKEQYTEVVNLLTANGYKNDETPEDNFQHYIENKHFQRFIDLISFLKSNNIEVSCKAMAISYKLDVVIRRQLSEVLKPIELGIIASLSHYFKFNDIETIGDIKNGLLDDMSSFSVSLAQKRSETQKYVFKSLDSIDKKYNCGKQLQKIICKFSFGQTVAFIEILNEEILKQIFSRKKESFKNINTPNKGQLIKILDDVVYLRNFIAHHNMILTNKKKVNGKRKFILSNLVESLDKIAIGNYKDDLKKALDKYLVNSIKKYYSYSTKDSKKELYKNIFSAANKIIF